MPRQARQRSNTGIYHVMIRGIDKRDIFLDEEDRTKFIECLLKAKGKGKFKIYGYCLKEYEINNINKMPIKERNKIIEKIYNETESSIRQLSRILGIGKTIIEKAVKKDL